MKLYRITKEGYWMGYKGPMDKLMLTDRQLALLKLVNCPVEEYDTEEEAKKEVKPEVVDEKVTKPEETVTSAISENKVQELEELPVMDIEAASTIDDDIDAVLNAVPDKIESNMDIPKEIAKPTIEQWTEAVENHFESEIITEPSFAYNDEMLTHLTIKQMKEVLLRRGHNKMRDPFRGKELDRRADLIFKIKSTNPEK